MRRLLANKKRLFLGLLAVAALGLGLGLALAMGVTAKASKSKTTPTTARVSPSTSSLPSTTTTPTTAPVTHGLVFGLSVPSLVEDTPSELTAALANMKSIGLQWVRVEANWSRVQADGPTSFDWSAIDQEVQAIEAAGMKVDLVIDNTPGWARDPSAEQDWGEPASATAYATYAGEVAARYGPMGVKAYEIWNEPNNQAFWFPAPNPTLYATMLKDAYGAIKVAEPDSIVISGGLAPEANNGTDIAPITFVQDMYANGAQGSFDALGDHAYSYPTLPDTYETYSGWSQMNETTPSLRSVMVAHGDGNKQIWITEIGAPSAGPNGVGTAAQAEEVTEAVAGARGSSWIGAMFFYNYEDDASNPDYYGLLNADGSPKPAWTALIAALAS